jgi:uncharacterized membrane protein
MFATIEGRQKCLRTSHAIIAFLAMCAGHLLFLAAGAGAQTADAASLPGSSSLPEGARPSATVSSAVHHDSSDPLTLMRPAARTRSQVVYRPRAHSRNLNVQDVPGSGAATEAAVAQNLPLIGFAALAMLNFDGVGNGFTGPAGTFVVPAAPPTANGDVGPHHYVQVVNDDFAVFDKSGAVLFGPVAVNTLWSGFGGGCETSTDGDATVLYDSIADRWMISQSSELSNPSLQCVAISQTPDPTGAYYRYSFSYPFVNVYPLLGVWPDAYYATFEMVDPLGNRTPGPKACAYDRASMLTGAPATQQCFDVPNGYTVLLPADLDGTRLPPTGAPNPIVAMGLFDGTGNGSTLAAWKFHVDWLNPANSTLSGPTTLSVDPYQLTCATQSLTCIPQLNGAQLVSLGDLLMYRLAYRNFADGHQSLVVNHSVVAGASSGVRWYELRLDPLGNPSVFQQGTYAPDANWRWMGSAAMDQLGNIALGYSTSSSSLTPSIRYTGRLATDPAGQMTQGETTVIAGGGSQTGALNEVWGGLSMMAIDPTDDCTFWYTNEYIPADGALNWRTRIASFKFPSCGPPADDFTIAASPTSISTLQGGSASTTITTTVTAGNPQSVALSVAGLPASATAAFGPASVTAGGSLTLTISTTTSTPAGSYALSVTGTGVAAAHTTQVTLVVSPAVLSDFSISATPSFISVGASGVATSPISTAMVTGPVETITFSVSGNPAGASISIAPGSVTTGGVAIISVNSGTAAPGSYAITITGRSPSRTHSVVVTLNITAGFRDFSIGIAPATANLPAGGTVSYTISSSATPGAQFVALLVAGLPAGVTGSFSPSNIRAGNPSVLTLTAIAAAAPTTATFIVTGTNNFGTHSVTAQVTVTPRPDFALAVAPPAAGVVMGGTATYAISTAAINGSTQPIGLSVSGLPAGTTGAFTQATVIPGGGATLSIATSAGMLPGTYNLTVTGTSAAATHSATASLIVTIAAANDFWMNLNPVSVSAFAGATVSTTISTTIAAGSAQTLAFSVSGLPAGATATFTPASISSGSSTVLTVVLVSTTPAGNYPLTIAASGTGASHSVVFSVSVSATTIVNGDFETGDLTGWKSTGTTSVARPGHGGNFAAMLGSTSPTNGDSTISQTFTAPPGVYGLSVWYKETCPDTITYDWATATLRDNTAGTTATLIGKMCANTAWTNATSSLTAGHNYTLTLVNHDDNYPGDPTYALFDDVSIQVGPVVPGGGIVNGGFEMGLAGWSTAGASESIVSSGAHSGSSALLLGSSLPTNGDSSASQTFTAPVGATQLSFWYRSSCPDTVTYDWATATLRNNSAGTTDTMVPKFCSVTAWTRVTAAVVPGQSYTLTLTNHDDNYPGDPTYTLFDDVSIQ